MQLNEDLCYHMKQKSCSGFYCRGHKKNLNEEEKKSIKRWQVCVVFMSLIESQGLKIGNTEKCG